MKNEMANTAAKKPLDEMAFSAMVAADEWLENHETNLDWSDTYALIHKMRKCIVEALPILRKPANAPVVAAPEEHRNEIR